VSRLGGAAIVRAATLVALGGLACASQQGALNPDTFEARKKLTRELVARADWSTAFAYADQLHRERPRDAETLVLRGTIYRERNLPREAEADLRAALEQDDRLAEAHAALGILYDVTLRAALAEKEHRAAVKLAPNSAGYLNNLGFSLFLRGKQKDAIKYYEQAARLEPTSRRVRTNLGFACAANGELTRAAHEFEMGGSAAEAKNNLGFAYERRGDMGHAYDLYVEAATLDPKSTHARSNLVHAARTLGRELPPALAAAPVQIIVPPAGAAGAGASPLVSPNSPAPSPSTAADKPGEKNP
jgi:Flp pilus assembly protein TadD